MQIQANFVDTKSYYPTARRKEFKKIIKTLWYLQFLDLGNVLQVDNQCEKV